MAAKFHCPDCKTELISKQDILFCSKCGRDFFCRNGIYVLLPKNLSENKIKEDLVHTLKGEDNSWYNNQIWYYFIHLSSHVIRFEKEFLPKIEGQRILELACGNSWASLMVKRKDSQWEVYASDVSFHCLDIQAREMTEIMKTKADYFVACDGESLPFADNYFDTVFVIASLHHFLNIDKALSEVKRVLKPGGVFLAADGMMPKIAQKFFKDEFSERTKRFGILERKITYQEWNSYLKKSGISQSALSLYYDPSYLHAYPTNADEEKLINKNWIFNVAKEIIYKAILSRIDQTIIRCLKLQYIFPSGIVINYRKPKR